MRQPFPLHVAEHYASTLALCAGDLAEAEAAARRSHEWSRLLTGRAASGIYGIQMFGIRREQGRLAELAAVARMLALDERSAGVWRPGFAAAARRARDGGGGPRGSWNWVRREGFERLRSSLWVAVAHLSRRCLRASSATTQLAALVYPELAPLAGGNVVVGHGVACYGAADRFLGLLATTLGDHERAVGHFERALAINRRMGARDLDRPHALRLRPDAAHARPGRGRAPRGRAAVGGGGAGDRIGLPALLAGPRPSEPGWSRSSPPPDGLSWREVEILRLVAAGLSNREIGDAAVHQRPHGRQPRPQHPAQDRGRQPHRGRRLRPSKCPGDGARTRGSIASMPIYLIERRFAEQLEMTSEDVRLIEEVNADEGVSWLFSFLSADRHRTYCLYEAPSPDAIVTAARRAGIPADAVTEVDRVTADTFR